MRVMITGAAGFLGRELANAILAAERLRAADGSWQAIEELFLVDRIEAAPLSAALSDAHKRARVRQLTGDLREPGFVDRLAALRCDAVFHLAASLTLDAENDPSVAFDVNVDALHRFIKSSLTAPIFVFASSIAVFGGALPDIVDDSVRSEPDTTYGMHKAVAELLLADYSRKGRVDARTLRLPIVLLRPGAPTPTVSDRIAAIVRKPMRGKDVECGLHADTLIPVASAAAVARALIALHDAPAAALPRSRALNLPSFTVRVSGMIEAIESYRATRALGQVRFVPDKALQRIVDGWPAGFASEAASKLGIHADASFAEIMAIYADNLSS